MEATPARPSDAPGITEPTLSPAELADAVGVSESSVKRWVDRGLIAAQRTPGGHRRIARSDALRFVRERGMPVLRPARLMLPEVGAEAASTESARARELLTDHFMSGRDEAARALLLGLYLAGEPVARICDRVLAPAMRRVGALWLEGREGILVEHRATALCARVFGEIASALPRPGPGVIAVGGAPGFEAHGLASAAVALVLREAGVRAVDLGAKTPIELLARSVAAQGARLAWLSITGDGDAPDPSDGILATVDAIAPHGAHLVVGGSWASARAWPARDNLHVGASMADLVALVGHLGLVAGTAAPDATGAG